MSLRRNSVHVALAASLAAGCAAGGAGERPARPTVTGGEFGTPDCFLRQIAQDFEVLDDRNVIVFAPGRSSAYHVQVSPPDGDLRFVQSLGFESSDSRICGYGGDSLIIANAGGGPQRLSVTGVYRLDSLALQGLEARFGKREPAAGAEPQPGAGAEIERELDSPHEP